MKYLVPIYYTLSSLNTAVYVINVAAINKAELYFYEPILENQSAPIQPMSESKEDITENDEPSRINKFVQSCFEKVTRLGIEKKINYRCISQKNSVVDFAKNNSIDFIVIGGQDLNNNSTLYNQYPLFIIPDNFIFQPIERIGFAEDYEKEDEATIALINEMAKAFSASIRIMHIYELADQDNPQRNRNYQNMKYNLLRKTKEVTFDFINGFDIVDTIDKYVRDNSIDVMSFVRRKSTAAKYQKHPQVGLIRTLIEQCNFPIIIT